MTLDETGGTYQAMVALWPQFTFQKVDAKGIPIGKPFVVDTADPPVPGFPMWFGTANGAFTFNPPAEAYSDENSSNFFYEGNIVITRTDIGNGTFACAASSASASIR